MMTALTSKGNVQAVLAGMARPNLGAEGQSCEKDFCVRSGGVDAVDWQRVGANG